MRLLFLTWVMLVFISPAALSQDDQQPDRFLGILELPPLCWWECANRDKPLPLYPSPSPSSPPALLLRREMLYFDLLHQNRDSAYWPVTEEFGYEMSGAVVFERRAGWFRIRIGAVDFWVSAQDTGAFHPYPQILKDKLAYLLEWDYILWEVPGEEPLPVDHPFKDDPELAGRVPVEIQDIMKVDGKIWVQVKVFRHSPCVQGAAPFFAEGWVSAYTEDSRRALWFYSRGC